MFEMLLLHTCHTHTHTVHFAHTHTHTHTHTKAYTHVPNINVHMHMHTQAFSREVCCVYNNIQDPLEREPGACKTNTHAHIRTI